MSDQAMILLRNKKAEQIELWLSQSLDIVRSHMRAAGFAVDDFDITLRFKDGDFYVKVTR